MAGPKTPSREVKEEALNITSMMDLMTIILVFLLKSYSTQDISIAGDADLELPSSTSQKDPELAVNLVVSGRQIVVDGVPVLQLTKDPDEENPGQEIVAVPEDQAEDVLDRLRGLGERGHRIGTIERKADDEAPILFDPGFLGIDPHAPQ